MDRYSFIVYIKTEDVYKDISEDVKKRFKTSNYEVDRLLLIGKNQKAASLMKDELGGQIMKIFSGLRPKTYSCLKDNNDEGNKAKGTKTCCKKKT